MLGAPVLLLVVDSDRREVLGKKVPEQFCYQALFAVDYRRCPNFLHLLSGVGPKLMEIHEISNDVFLRLARRRRPKNHASREPLFLTKLSYDTPESTAFIPRIDLPRHTDVVDRRHEHEETAGKSNV